MDNLQAMQYRFLEESEPSEAAVRAILKTLEKIIIQDPEHAPEIFTEIIRCIPREITILLRIAWLAKNKICVLLLLDHAQKSRQIDALIFAFLPVLDDWMERPFFFEVYNRLLEMARPETIVHLLRAANPRKRPHLVELLVVDQLWLCAVSKFLAQNQMRRAYECILDAGSGFLQNPKDPGVQHLDSTQKAFLLDLQTWKNTDTFFPTYSRASDVATLIRMVWEAHRQSGKVDSYGIDECVGTPTYNLVISARDIDGSLVVAHQKCPVPHRGLIARFAEEPVHVENIPGLLFVKAPTLQHTTLRTEGAMLQQLILHYLVMVIDTNCKDEYDISEIG